jgi:hypothetical protein
MPSEAETGAQSTVWADERRLTSAWTCPLKYGISCIQYVTAVKPMIFRVTTPSWLVGFLALSLTSMPLAEAIGNPSEDDAYETTGDAKKIAWMDRGMEAVKLKLKDPKSADFRSVYFNRGGDNIPMTCGQVNARNSFGGYMGFQRFISAGTPDLTFLESEVSDFDQAWARFC